MGGGGELCEEMRRIRRTKARTVGGDKTDRVNKWNKCPKEPGFIIWARLHELIPCANMITSSPASITIIAANYRIKGNIWVRSKGIKALLLAPCCPIHLSGG